MVSLGGKVERVIGLPDGDLTEFERELVRSIEGRYEANGKKTDWLSDKQIAIIDRLFNKHFSG